MGKKELFFLLFSFFFLIFSILQHWLQIFKLFVFNKKKISSFVLLQKISLLSLLARTLYSKDVNPWDNLFGDAGKEFVLFYIFPKVKTVVRVVWCLLTCFHGC